MLGTDEQSVRGAYLLESHPRLGHLGWGQKRLEVGVFNIGNLVVISGISGFIRLGTVFLLDRDVIIIFLLIFRGGVRVVLLVQVLEDTVEISQLSTSCGLLRLARGGELRKNSLTTNLSNISRRA